MKSKINKFLKLTYKISIYTIVITIALAAVLAVGYFLIPYLVKELKTPKNFSVVLCDKIYESRLPKPKELDYAVKKYGIKSIVFLNDNISKESAYIFQYVNNNKMRHFFGSAKSNILSNRNEALEFIKFINAQSNQPVLVCSTKSGKNIDTLMVVYRVGCLRWGFSDAISDTKNHYSDAQKKAIRKFTYKLKNKCCTLEPAIQNIDDALNFVVLGDAYHKVWQKTLKNIWRNCAKGQPVLLDFVIGVGDMIHSRKLFLVYKKYFSSKKGQTPVYLPALGNHEEGWVENGDEEVRDEIIPEIKTTVRYNKTTCNYYVDKKT